MVEEEIGEEEEEIGRRSTAEVEIGRPLVEKEMGEEEEEIGRRS